MAFNKNNLAFEAFKLSRHVETLYFKKIYLVEYLTQIQLSQGVATI